MKPSEPVTGPGARVGADAPVRDPIGELPPALSSLWRTFRLGYRAEPRLLALSLGLALLTMLPDALLAFG